MEDAGSSLSPSYQTQSGLTVTRLQPLIGAEIAGADLCSPVPEEVAGEIRRALLDHGVIFFRGQPINYPQHLALACIFGKPHVEGFLPEMPEIMPLISDAGNTNPAGRKDAAQRYGHFHGCVELRR
jgi:alpha-ketoglutarate-dependent taurine dioxygenase